MTIHQMKLSESPFKKILSGQKTIESRLFDEKREQINLGDYIEFVLNNNPDEKIITKVKALYRYKTFEELFSDFTSSTHTPSIPNLCR